MIRFTTDVVAKVLMLNNGAKFHTIREGKDGGSGDWYLIKDGKLLWRKDPDSEWDELGYKETRIFLQRYQGGLKLPVE